MKNVLLMIGNITNYMQFSAIFIYIIIISEQYIVLKNIKYFFCVIRLIN